MIHAWDQAPDHYEEYLLNGALPDFNYQLESKLLRAKSRHIESLKSKILHARAKVSQILLSRSLGAC